MTKTIRIKFGKNMYSSEFTCAHCGRNFKMGGFFLRVELSGIIVDVPICHNCFYQGSLFEGMLDMSKHSASHPIGLA